MRMLVSTLVSLFLVGPALAAEQTVLGQRMTVLDPLPGVNPSKRIVLVVAKEKLSDDTVVGDPLAEVQSSRSS